MTSKYPMVSVDAAMGAVMDASSPLEVEKVSILQKSVYHGNASSPALGRVLAANVVAEGDPPPFAASPVGELTMARLSRRSDAICARHMECHCCRK